MPRYTKTKSNVSEIVKIANKFIEAGIMIDDSEKLIEIAHEIGSETLAGNFPDTTLLGSLTNLLQDQGITFALIGGVAVSVHGLMRNTDDIDALVSKLPDVSDVEYARRFGFYKAKSSTGTVLTIDHRKDGYVELLLATSNIMNYALKTATPRNVLGYNVPVAAPDALIGLKVQALVESPKREYKDSLDILGVYKKNNPDLKGIRAILSETENIKLNEILGITKNV